MNMGAEGTSGVILAAGYSSRLGMFKMTCPVGGVPAVERCIAAMEPSCGEIVVVGGHRIELLSYLPEKFVSVKLVFNESFASGMFSSVLKGLSAVSGGQAFVAPGDCPLIPACVYGRLLAAEGGIVVPACGGKTGHPVLLRREAIDSLLAGGAMGCGTLRSFIRACGCSTVEMHEPGILIDMDTREDCLSIQSMAGEAHGPYRDGAGRQRQYDPPQ
jgi:molybdenum cofactor cytidylyltransferase